MEHAARRFARRILLSHAALMAVVLAVVVLAGRQIYRAAQDEVLAQAKGRQQLLAAATARGIENHYASILNDMDLLRRADSATGATTQPMMMMPATRAVGGGGPMDRIMRFMAANGRNPSPGQLGGVIGSGVMWRQLQGRVTALFAYDRAPPPAGRPTLAPLIGSDDAEFNPGTVLRQSAEWLAAQRAPSVSEYQQWGDVSGNLVCVPLRGDPFRMNFNRGRPDRPDGANRPQGGSGPPSGMAPAGPPPLDEPPEWRGDREFFGGRPPAVDRLTSTGPTTRPMRGERGPLGNRRGDIGNHDWALVAVVPIGRVGQEFLQPLNEDPATGAWLIDQRWTAMAASRADLVGTDMAKLTDPQLKPLADRYIAGHQEGCEVIDRPFDVGPAHFQPAMVAAEPVTIANRQWELFVSTRLDSVNGNVDRLFRRVLWWGGGVAVFIAGILASTAWWLIRSRMRVERLRHEVLTKELAEARRIQLAWLPKAMPSAATVDLAATNSPANHISGDFYNWFDLPDGRLAVTIGDVTGHGMSAAFLMATAQLLVRTTLARIPDPGACLAEVNRQLCVQAFNGQFVTMIVAVLDPATRRLDVATAGHPAPLVLNGHGFVPLRLEPQLVLGVDDEATYGTESHDLPAGAAVLLYTDGVIECPAGTNTPQAGQRFGTDRLRHAVGVSTAASAKHLVDRVVAAIDAFRGSRDLDDDLTVVAVRLRGGPEASPG